ncbi:hypothetical protein [Vibrio parahaemolyticus]|uniref:hypothetical protein n=1 Tax=Vibrio parahaemolyticus TaxID=670 RepID=UPI00226A2F23|nr:hypothetical protein [Vibrio parahaemolyticus]MCX8948048.1 hypothetical protein [Vibrio parahaemolyticus]
MSNTLVFDYAVSISEAQSATEADYSFLYKCLVMVTGSYTPPAEEGEEAPVKTSKKSAKATRDIIDPALYKVVPIYDPTLIANYTANTEVQYLMTGGLEKFYLLILADEVDPENTEAIDFDPTDYFTLCFSKEIDIATAQTIDFTDFDGVRAYATSDEALAEQIAMKDTVFLDDAGSYTGCYEAFGRLLSQAYWRNCQYYVLDSSNPASVVFTVGKADDLFNKRISFFLNGSDGPTLGFFGNGGSAITKAYIDRQAQLKTQEAITSYIQTNEPNNTAVQRVNIEEAASEVIDTYEGFPYFYLDPDSNNYISIVKSDEQYVVGGKAEVKDAEPIWRARIEVTEAQ